MKKHLNLQFLTEGQGILIYKKEGKFNKTGTNRKSRDIIGSRRKKKERKRFVSYRNTKERIRNIIH